LILYELVVGKSPFSKNLKQPAVTKLLILEDARPDIPDFVLPEVGKLIRDCWATNPDDRPSFNQILRRLERMNFKLTANANSSKCQNSSRRSKSGKWPEVLNKRDSIIQCVAIGQQLSIGCARSRHSWTPEVNVEVAFELTGLKVGKR
jgi:hypothetical protein